MVSRPLNLNEVPLIKIRYLFSNVLNKQHKIVKRNHVREIRVEAAYVKITAEDDVNVRNQVE